MISARGLTLGIVLAGTVQATAAAPRVYVTSQDGSQIAEIATGKNNPTAFPSLPGPVVITATPDGRRLFITHPEHHTISAVDLQSGKIIAHFPYAGMPFGIVFDGSTNRLFVTDWTRNLLSALDANTGRLVREVKTGRSPAHLVFDAEDHRLFVCEREGNTVGVYDSRVLAAVKSIPVGKAPFALTYSAKTGRVYTANVRSNDVSVIDARSLKAVATIHVGSMPYGTAVTPDGDRLLVTIQAKNALAMLDAKSLKTLSEIRVGRYPEDVVAADNATAYVTDWFSDAVSVIDLMHGKEIRRIGVAAGPRDARLRKLRTTHEPRASREWRTRQCRSCSRQSQRLSHRKLRWGKRPKKT